ncbi:MAG: hypothetical protein ACKPIB_19890, partial [Dolichospermum sp.]
FTKFNPVSQTMQRMLDVLEGQSLQKDVQTLEKFYQSVRERASGIDNAEGKQRIIIELYDKFFRAAFPKLVERLGIVYTPVEAGRFHSPKLLSLEPFNHQYLGVFLILINQKLGKKGSISLCKRVLRK